MKIKSSKKWFTLVELLIVVAIVGLMFTVSYQIFSAKNTSEMYSQWLKCANYANVEIQNFITRAKQGQDIRYYNGDTTRYKIKFNSNNDIILWSNDKDLENMFWNSSDEIQNIDVKANCETNYNIELEWTPFIVNMTKWLKSNQHGEMKWFFLTNSNWSTNQSTDNTIILKTCDGNYCIDVSKFTVNEATSTIKQQTCVAHNDEEDGSGNIIWDKNKCARWQ